MWVKDSSVSTKLARIRNLEMQLSAAQSKVITRAQVTVLKRGGKYEKHAISRYDDKRQKM